LLNSVRPQVLPRYVWWLLEDAPHGDVTSEAVVPEDAEVEAHVIVEDDSVAACMDEALELITMAGLKARATVKDGEWVRAGTAAIIIEGNARRALLIERTLLNMLTYCFSVATATKEMVSRARSVNPRVRVAATRKAPPGLLHLAKKAVVAGGGDTHRLSLSHMILIKDNHLRIVNDLREAVMKARERAGFTMKVEVEVESPEDAVLAAEAGADIVMLDNMSPEEVRRAVKLLEERGLRGKVIVEASGGITAENVRKYAAAGVDVISSGSITMNPGYRRVKMEIVKVLWGGHP